MKLQLEVLTGATPYLCFMRNARARVAERLEPTKQLTRILPWAWHWQARSDWGKQFNYFYRQNSLHPVSRVVQYAQDILTRGILSNKLTKVVVVVFSQFLPSVPAPCTQYVAPPGQASLYLSLSECCPAWLHQHSWGGGWCRAQWEVPCSLQRPCCPPGGWGKPAAAQGQVSQNTLLRPPPRQRSRRWRTACWELCRTCQVSSARSEAAAGDGERRSPLTISPATPLTSPTDLRWIYSSLNVNASSPLPLLSSSVV